MSTKTTHTLVANFGGPRHLKEVYPFLQALLTDQDVVRTGLPQPIHSWLFTQIAKRRARRIAHDYTSIGGKSPIYGDTERVAELLRERLDTPVSTFHRYLPETHAPFIEELRNLSADEIRVFPMFPQFTYATTGSIARWFQENLPEQALQKMRWIKSYPAHPSFITAQQQTIRHFLNANNLNDQETILLFSAHGVPKRFVKKGDIYQQECEASFEAVMTAFPKALGRLSYQSKFGPGEWLRPYTSDVSANIREWNNRRKHVVFVPITFTSDHIETLFEVEQEYMLPVRAQGLQAHRVPALTHDPLWIDAIVDILHNEPLTPNDLLIRN